MIGNDLRQPTSGYHCQVCGQFHPDLPLSYGTEAPALWYELPEAERTQRAVLSVDQCEIDQHDFFVAGNIDIPIIGSGQVFQWTVWVSLSPANYARTIELWNRAGRESEPPYFGWLSTSLPLYPDTLNLKTNVHTNPVGQRPWIELEPTEHPLAVEQRAGITWKRVQEMAELLLHGDD